MVSGRKNLFRYVWILHRYLALSKRPVRSISSRRCNCNVLRTNTVRRYIGLYWYGGWVLSRVISFFVPKPSIHGQTTEAAMSFILTGVFSVSLFLITGIGGPGQSVGDLYYGSWMAFLASLVASSSIYSDIKSNTSRSGEL